MSIDYPVVVVDSSVLVAYERVTAAAGDLPMREAQYRIASWLMQRTLLLIPAMSLLVAARECTGKLPEVSFLLDGDADLVHVVPMARDAALDLGASASGATPTTLGDDLEIAHVVWCAAGGADNGDSGSAWPVATFWPAWYSSSGVPVIRL